MRILRFAIVLVWVCSLWADQHSVDSDPAADFTQFHSFAIRQGNLASRRPELSGPLVRQRIEEAIRSDLTAKGLHVDEQGPDLIVNYRLGAADRREIETTRVGRFGRGVRQTVTKFTEGTLVIDLVQREDRTLVWRGIYTDEESDAAKLSKKLTDDIKKLFQEYPPKK